MRNLFIYKDFLFQLTKKHYVNFYKQTVSGPLLQLINPLLQSGLFAVIFGEVIKISTDNNPHFLFYLISITFFNFFRNSVTKCSNVYYSYQQLFRSFYFPKILIFISLISENLIIYITQFFFLIIVLIIYQTNGYDTNISLMNLIISFIPIFYLILLSLVIGIIFSAITIKYRDLNHFITYFLQIIFFGSPVLYTEKIISNSVEWIQFLNPLYYPICFYRSLFFYTDKLPSINFLYSSFLFLIIFTLISNKMLKYADRVFDDYV